jgi:CO/xanthine dehydrogenase Mo-binding subunit
MQPVIAEVRSEVFGNNSEGFEAVGKTGTVAASAAIVAAIEDALPIGVKGRPDGSWRIVLVPLRL